VLARRVQRKIKQNLLLGGDLQPDRRSARRRRVVSVAGNPAQTGMVGARHERDTLTVTVNALLLRSPWHRHANRVEKAS